MGIGDGERGFLRMEVYGRKVELERVEGFKVEAGNAMKLFEDVKGKFEFNPVGELVFFEGKRLVLDLDLQGLVFDLKVEGNGNELSALGGLLTRTTDLGFDGGGVFEVDEVASGLLGKFVFVGGVKVTGGFGAIKAGGTHTGDEGEKVFVLGKGG